MTVCGNLDMEFFNHVINRCFIVNRVKFEADETWLQLLVSAFKVAHVVTRTGAAGLISFHL